MQKKSVVLFSVLCILAACNNANKKRERDIPELRVMALQAKDVSLPKGYICEINAVHYVEIHARVQGYLDEIYVDEGQWVKKGQPLFRISSNEYKEMVSKAEANLQRAIAEAKTKELEVDRIKLMVDKKIISSTELEVAKAKKQAAESGIAEAKSVLQNARINLNYTFIRATFDGIVDRIPFKIGSLINSGTLLTSVSNIDEVFAYFRVSESEYLAFQHAARTNAIPKKQRVSLILADGSSYPHTGYVETMEGDFDKQTGSIAFRARFKNPDKLLKHGSSGKILIQKILEDAVLVPQQSTFTIQDKNYVFILNQKNVAKAKSFDVVDRYEKYFIARDLEEGQKIIIEGLQQLRDGAPVKPKLVQADTARISRLSSIE